MTQGAQRVTVRGVVQGVNFRAATRRRAMELGVSGWVRNDPEGSVTAHLEGAAGAVAQLLDFLRTGPPSAEVAEVEVADVPAEGTSGFAIR